MKKLLLVISKILILNTFGYSQELDVLELISKDKLFENNVKQIEIYNFNDKNQKIIRQRLFINKFGLLDSSFIYSHTDTNQIISFKKNIYNNNSYVISSILGIETYDFQTDPPVKKVDSTFINFVYKNDTLIREEINTNLLDYNLIEYKYKESVLTNKYLINSLNNDTITVIHYFYSRNNQIIQSSWEKNGNLVYQEISKFDENNNLLQKHMKNTQVKSRLTFEDYYFYYDIKNNRLKWNRFDGINNTPFVYNYIYDQNGLLIKHENPWTTEVVNYK